MPPVFLGGCFSLLLWCHQECFKIFKSSQAISNPWGFLIFEDADYMWSRTVAANLELLSTVPSTNNINISFQDTSTEIPRVTPDCPPHWAVSGRCWCKAPWTWWQQLACVWENEAHTVWKDMENKRSCCVCGTAIFEAPAVQLVQVHHHHHWRCPGNHVGLPDSPEFWLYKKKTVTKTTST